MPNKSKLLIAIFLLLFGMISLYSGAVIAKWLFTQVSTEVTVILRLTFGAIILTAFIQPWKGTKITLSILKSLLFYGVTLGLMNFLFYMAIQSLPIGLAVTLEFVGPLSLALIAARKFLDFMWVALAVLGIYLLMPNHNHNQIDINGMIYALSAGAMWALYILFGHKSGANLGMRAAPLGTLIAAITVIPLGFNNLLLNMETLLTPQILAAGALMALMTSTIPYGIELYAMTKMPARTFSILMSLEPVMGALMGLILLDEKLLFIQWFAIVAIVIASCGATISICKT